MNDRNRDINSAVRSSASYRAATEGRLLDVSYFVLKLINYDTEGLKTLSKDVGISVEDLKQFCHETFSCTP